MEYKVRSANHLPHVAQQLQAQARLAGQTTALCNICWCSAVHRQSPRLESTLVPSYSWYLILCKPFKRCGTAVVADPIRVSQLGCIKDAARTLTRKSQLLLLLKQSQLCSLQAAARKCLYISFLIEHHLYHAVYTPFGQRSN